MRRPALALTVLAAATAGALLGSTLAGAAAGGPGSGLASAELTGTAELPALTFGKRARSGTLISAANGVVPPFARQPVQGFSSVLPQADGSTLVLSDNGYGSKDNSADFLLRVNRVRISTADGAVTVLGGFGLSDPDGRVPFALTRPDRQLTGADFDPESFRRLPDGTFWFGEEFGPFLLHTDARGRVLSPPVPLAGVASPQDPLGRPATLGASRGFEGMALSVDGASLRPMLEGTVAGDPAGDLRILSFDLAEGAYDPGALRYRLEEPGNAIGELTAIDEDRFLVIERDNLQGAAARFKAVFVIDTRDTDGDGYVDKDLLVNLLAVPDPQRLGGEGPFFSFPFQTIESIALLDDETLLLANDNNFPFSSGRTPGSPDDDEFITVRLGTPLDADPRALRR